MMRLYVKAVARDEFGNEHEIEVEVGAGNYGWSRAERVIRGDCNLGRYEFLAPEGFEPFERVKGGSA